MTIHARPSPADDLAGLLADIRNQVTAAFATIEWAEDEITRAIARHPQAADRLYHAFSLLYPREIGPGMHTEFVYRAHARELLDRVATGADTQQATAAEICVACAEISMHSPMHEAAAGLYFRMWLHAFPDHPITDNQIHYERLYGARIDSLETLMRAKLTDPDRRLGDIHCTGQHDLTTRPEPTSLTRKKDTSNE